MIRIVWSNGNVETPIEDSFRIIPEGNRARISFKVSKRVSRSIGNVRHGIEPGECTIMFDDNPVDFGSCTVSELLLAQDRYRVERTLEKIHA